MEFQVSLGVREPVKSCGCVSNSSPPTVWESEQEEEVYENAPVEKSWSKPEPVDTNWNNPNHPSTIKSQGSKVYVQSQPPIVVDRKQQTVHVKAGKAILINPAPVVIQRKQEVDYRPIVVKHQQKPLIVHKKIVQISRPIHKKYFVEQYTKKEECPCKDQITNVEQQVPSCGCGNAIEKVYSR